MGRKFVPGPVPDTTFVEMDHEKISAVILLFRLIKEGSLSVTSEGMCTYHYLIFLTRFWGMQWLSGRVLDSRPRGREFEPHRRHCVVFLEQDLFILASYWFNPGRPVSV